MSLRVACEVAWLVLFCFVVAVLSFQGRGTFLGLLMLYAYATIDVILRARTLNVGFFYV